MPPALTSGLSGTQGEASPPRLYRPEEIAETLGCSAWWVKDRARRRLIPHTRIGRSYRFTAGHLVEIVRLYEERPPQARTATAAPAPVPPAATAAMPPPRTSGASTPGLRSRPPRRALYDAVV
ncbi:helix-turn-helix domain-containing protein [Streptomyces sp. 8L]|nr:helix-turn-helix domain-containing protein [Streptomyces sp. 8L]MCA1223216.1 helix-turn-helix domain-containing protein [Streptomyces sp. 8L]